MESEYTVLFLPPVLEIRFSSQFVLSHLEMILPQVFLQARELEVKQLLFCFPADKHSPKTLHLYHLGMVWKELDNYLPLPTAFSFTSSLSVDHELLDLIFVNRKVNVRVFAAEEEARVWLNGQI